MTDRAFIEVRGARENDLKDISLDIPKRKLTVFTGVSGSGKSSLVFDAIAAEAQRQLNETFSFFVRLRHMVDIGPGYLSLSRETSTLSGGESQRVKMIRHLGNNLTEMLYLYGDHACRDTAASVGSPTWGRNWRPRRLSCSISAASLAALATSMIPS
jgi:excinuclease UvrABC ATPase subunit